jgi:acetolactate synthase I/II/III large subunit
MPSRPAIEWEYDDTPIRLPGYRPDLSPMPADMQRALDMIHSAKRPVILAGRGVLMSGAMPQLLEFAEKTRPRWP